MPQIDFYFVDSEMERLVDFALNLGLEWIPDMKFERPEAIVYRDRKGIIERARSEPHWFLTRNDFSKLPLDFRRIEGGLASGMYFIMQRHGGPAFHLFWSGLKAVRSIHFVRTGSLSYYGTYWNVATEELEKAPETQRALYRKLAAFIKAESVDSENPPGWRPVRIGKEAALQWALGLQLGWEEQTRGPKVVPQE